MSARSELYTDLKAKLITISGLETNGTIEHVAIWNSQPLNAETNKPVQYPMVYIEFEKANYLEPKQIVDNTNIKGEQNYISNITLHIWTKHLTTETEHFFDKEELLEYIKYYLKSMNGTHYGPLRLISDDYEKDHGNLFESQLIFSSLVQESGIYGDMILYKDGTEYPSLEIDKEFI